MTSELYAGYRVGEYRVVAHASGTLYRAQHVNGARVMLDLRSADDYRLVCVQMLRAMATLEAIDHPGIARLVAHGVMWDHRPWLATELPDGPTLDGVTPSGDQLAALLRDVAEVLAYVHARGVVHGALRPQHIVIVEPTQSARYPVAIGEWSSCRAIGIPTFGSARPPSEYDAPECADGAIDGRADVFALGVIAAQAANEAEIDERLANLIEVMLEPNALHRPTMADVLEQLDALMTDEEDRVITSAKLPRPRWTPAPGALAPHLPPPPAGKRTARE